MSSEVNIIIKSDSTQVRKDVVDVESKVDTVVSFWASARAAITREIATTMRNITSLISTFKSVISAMGLTLDPWWNAMLTLVSATISALFAISFALTASVVGTGVAPFVAAAAAALSIFMVGKMAADLGRITAEMASVNRQITLLEERVPQVAPPFGGGI